jgi:hypothetical protein
MVTLADGVKATSLRSLIPHSGVGRPRLAVTGHTATRRRLGRCESEVAQVQAAVKANRLVTLTGVGGGDKTRLALGAASRLVDEFPDGVWFFELG